MTDAPIVPSVDRAAMLRQFAALPFGMQLGFLTAATQVFADRDFDTGTLEKNARRLTQEDQKEAKLRERQKPKSAA
jgi:hypothetical protein